MKESNNNTFTLLFVSWCPIREKLQGYFQTGKYLYSKLEVQGPVHPDHKLDSISGLPSYL